MFAAVVTRVTPSEGLLNGNTLLPYYPQLHGNNVANNAFYCLVKRRWGKAGGATCRGAGRCEKMEF